MHALLFFTGWILGSEKKHVEIIGRIIAGVAIAGALTTIVLSVVRDTYRAEGLLGNANALGGYLAVSLPVVIWCAWSVKNKLIRMLLVAPVVVALLMSFSYTAWVSVLAVSLFFLFSYRKKINAKKIIGCIVIALVCVFAYVGVRFVVTKNLTESVQFIPVESVRISFAQRFAFNEASLRMFVDHPVYGMGLGSYQQEYPQYAISVLEQPKYAHNYYLELLAETGVIAFVFFGMLYSLGRQFLFFVRKHSESSSVSFEMALVLTVVIGFVHAFFDFSLHFPSVGVLVWLVTGMAVAMTLTQREGVNILVRPAPVFSIRTGILLFACVLLIRGCMLGFSAMSVDTGDVERDRGASEHAILAYDSASAFDPDPEVILKSAQLQFQQGTQEGRNAAQKNIDRLLVWDAHSYFAYHLLGGIAYAEKRYDIAIEYFEKAIALDPIMHPNFHYNLAGAYRAQGRDNEAIFLIAEVLARHGDNTTYSSNPHLADQLAHLAYLAGQIYEARHNNDRAYKYYVQAVEYEPEFQPAVQARDAIKKE
jgi:O-antigen ligase